jgi:hypothetical protein
MSHPVARFRRDYDRARRSIIRPAPALHKGLPVNLRNRPTELAAPGRHVVGGKWEAWVSELIAALQDEQ